MDTQKHNYSSEYIDMLETALLVADHVDAMLAYWDKNGICRFANQAYRLWFGKTREQIINYHISELLGAELYQKNLPYIEQVLKGKVQVFEREIPLPEGGSRHSLATYTPYTINGQVQGFFVLVADSTLLKNMEKELIAEKEKVEMMATHDFLTGLPNRMLLLDRIESAIAYANKGNIQVGIISMDLDKFKHINDTFGHIVGDELLTEVAKRIKETIRESDTAARIGGDEFVLVISDIEEITDIQEVAENIIEAITQPFKTTCDTILNITISMGIALYPKNGTIIEEVLKKSDDALYSAKANGRRRFEFA